MPQIKRYPNRKLYDMEAKRYITLEEITSMIQAGEDIQVIDHETGDDLTSLTLTQIILEQEKKSAGFLPRSLLTSLIRTGGETLEHILRSIPGGMSASTLLHGEPGSAKGAEEPQPLTRADDRLSEVLHMLNVPTRRDMLYLQQQLSLLSDRIEEMLTTQDSDDPNAPVAQQETEKNAGD